MKFDLKKQFDLSLSYFATSSVRTISLLLSVTLLFMVGTLILTNSHKNPTGRISSQDFGHISSVPIDCGTENIDYIFANITPIPNLTKIQCMIDNATTCLPAKIVLNTTTDAAPNVDIKSSSVLYEDISQTTSNTCNLHLKQGIRDILRYGGTDTQKQILLELIKNREGLEGNCVFQNNSDVVNYFTSLKTSTRTLSSDLTQPFVNGQCSGPFFDSTVAPTATPTSTLTPTPTGTPTPETCLSCITQGKSILCHLNTNNSSFCSDTIQQGAACIFCEKPNPTPTPTAFAVPSPTLTLVPTVTITPTLRPSVTPTPSIMLTPTLTPTPTITLTPTPTPTPGPTANVSFDVKLPGIGGGISENNNPVQHARNFGIQLYDATDANVKQQEVQLTYNGNSYAGTALISGVPLSSYTIRIQSNNSILKIIPGVVKLAANITSTTPSVTLVTGNLNDVDGYHNVLDILDYNALLNCFYSSCTGSPFQQADLNDDGIINAKDVNILLRGFAIR